MSKHRFLRLSRGHVLLRIFHRELAWDRWLSAHANGVRQFKEVILAHSGCIASAESPEEFAEKLKTFKGSDGFLNTRYVPCKDTKECNMFVTWNICLLFLISFTSNDE